MGLSSPGCDWISVSCGLHPGSRGQFVLLNKLESGFLLFQTQQGLVAVEPSFWQRVYLLWTFRNFRQLSLPLLNPRQITLINDLFRQHGAVVSDDFEPTLEIGLVENFVPPEIEIGATLTAETDASPAVKEELIEQTAEPYVAPPVISMAAATAIEADVPLAVRWEDAEEEGAEIDCAEVAPKSALDRLFAPKASWLRFARSNPVASNLESSEPEESTSRVSRIAIFRYAAAIGALSLCAFFIFAFHRVGAVSGVPAHSSPPQINTPDPPSAPEPTPVAENPDPVPDVAPQAGDGPDAAVEPAPAKVAPAITATHRMTTPERASRGGPAHVASRSSGGSRAAKFSKAPTSTSTRRMTLVPAYRGAMTRSAQKYFDLANQQMHEGNYAAAEANYHRAWRIEENSAAAKGRLVRARRAMQAEKKSVAGVKP